MDESCYLKTLQKPFDCHKTVIIKVGERKKKMKGEHIAEGQKATGEYYLVSRDFLER